MKQYAYYFLRADGKEYIVYAVSRKEAEKQFKEENAGKDPVKFIRRETW